MKSIYIFISIIFLSLSCYSQSITGVANSGTSIILTYSNGQAVTVTKAGATLQWDGRYNNVYLTTSNGISYQFTHGIVTSPVNGSASALNDSIADMLSVGVTGPTGPTGLIDTSKAWSTHGNTGTGASNFIGTKDTKDLLIKTNDTTRIQIGKYGQISFKTKNYPSGYMGIRNNIGDTTQTDPTAYLGDYYQQHNGTVFGVLDAGSSIYGHTIGTFNIYGSNHPSGLIYSNDATGEVIVGDQGDKKNTNIDIIDIYKSIALNDSSTINEGKLDVIDTAIFRVGAKVSGPLILPDVSGFGQFLNACSCDTIYTPLITATSGVLISLQGLLVNPPYEDLPNRSPGDYFIIMATGATTEKYFYTIIETKK